jgi:hypothetical protein
MTTPETVHTKQMVQQYSQIADLNFMVTTMHQ